MTSTSTPLGSVDGNNGASPRSPVVRQPPTAPYSSSSTSTSSTPHVNLNLPERKPRRIVKAAVPKNKAAAADNRGRPEHSPPPPSVVGHDNDGNNSNVDPNDKESLSTTSGLHRAHSYPHLPADSALARELEHELINTVKQGTRQKVHDRRKLHQDQAKHDRRHRNGSLGGIEDAPHTTATAVDGANPFRRFLSAFSAGPKYPEHKRRATTAGKGVGGATLPNPPSIDGAENVVDNDDAAKPPAEKKFRSDDGPENAAHPEEGGTEEATATAVREEEGEGRRLPGADPAAPWALSTATVAAAAVTVLAVLAFRRWIRRS